MEAQETKTGATKIKTIAIYGVTVLVAVTFLLHIFLKHPSSSLDGIKAERRSNQNKIELFKDSIINSSVTASKTTLIELNSELKKLQAEETYISKQYAIKKKEARVSGFPSLHKFFWHFGIAIIILSLSIYLLITVKQYTGKKQKAANFASMLAITCSGYYMSWIFFPYDDLPYNTYMTLLVSIGVMSSFLAYYINKIDFSIVSNTKHLKQTIRNLFTFIFVEVEEKKLIAPEKRIEFQKRRVELVNEAIDE